MAIINWNQLMMLSSALALMSIAQLISAIPRKVELPKKIFAQDPPQPYLDFNIPVEFNHEDEISWDQQWRGIYVDVTCRIRNNFESQFQFFQDLKRNEALLENDPGRQYVLHPYKSFIFRGKRCFVMPESTNEELGSHMETLSSSDKAKAILPFFIKLIRGINYIHKVGWAGVGFKAFNAAKLDSDINPIINVMEIEQLRRIEFRNNAVLLIDPPQPDLLYSPEWIENTKIDPRKADLWEVGEFLYLNQYSDYYLSSRRSFERTIIETFSKVPDVQPNIGDMKKQFKKFMPHFKKFIEESYINAIRVDNNNRAVLLNTNSGLPTNIIATSPSPLKHIPLTSKILNLLSFVLDYDSRFSAFKTHLQFLSNGFFQLGIYCKVTSEYIQYPNEYGAIFSMINKLLPVNVEERLTLEQYLSQLIAMQMLIV
ncbi:hypothetical protein BDF19DRAFT_155112 [Syncephalis fuscata]|nr:hypothetical protein BDF19DRAFT_155112 [Syncephalis fuscata]